MNEIDLTQLDLNLLVTFEVLMTECSVTRAATRLGRTQSAVSHSLGRLREQVGDPLMVKQGGRMRPSPFAEQLIEDIRPILRGIQRVLSPPRPFVPASSGRTFRAALFDFSPALLPAAAARIRALAPGVLIEWLPADEYTVTRVREEQMDLALVRTLPPTTEGLEVQSAEAVPVYTFMRKDHAALANWSLAAWSRWPSIQVIVGDRRKTGLERALETTPVERRIGLKVPHFAGVPELLSRTDLIATLPLMLSDAELDRYGLSVVAPPLAVDPVRTVFIWSSRLTNDPGARWFRSQVMETFGQVLSAATRPMLKKRSKKKTLTSSSRGDRDP
jgi:DNA-binding transcriptional LysR family regulator